MLRSCVLELFAEEGALESMDPESVGYLVMLFAPKDWAKKEEADFGDTREDMRP